MHRLAQTHLRTFLLVSLLLVVDSACGFCSSSNPSSIRSTLLVDLPVLVPKTQDASSRNLRAGAVSSSQQAADEAATTDADNLPDDDESRWEQMSHLLDDALNSQSVASSTLITELTTLRQAGKQEEAEAYLDTLLSFIDGSDESRKKQPAWARKLPITVRFSRRARLASLGRVLDLSTPTPDDEEDSSDGQDAHRRRRRSLAVLLRTLATDNDERSGGKRFGARPTIRIIEKAAIKGAKDTATLDDMANRLPLGLETPKYEVIARRPPSKGGYEIRKYDPFAVCTVPMKKSIKANDEGREKTDATVSNPQLSGASSFGALAGYLFGKNSDEMPMAMTTPVLTTNAGSDATDADREMSFILPSSYWAKDGTERAPQPLDGSNVRLQHDNGGERAVLMFGGFANTAVVEEKKKKLLTSLQEDEDYIMKDGSTATLAQYNDPFTPPWKRRNEISVAVVAR